MIDFKTRWHRVQEAARAGRIVLSTKKEEAEPVQSLPKVWSQRGFDVAMGVFDSAPKFYFDKKVMDALMQHNVEVVKSLEAMQQAGVLRLPFPYILAEYDWGGPMLVCFSESKKDKNCPFRSTAMSLVRLKSRDDVLVLSPQTYYTSPIITLDDGTKGMRWKVFTAGWVQETPEGRKLAGEAGTEDYWKPEIEPGLVACMLLLNTRGIVREHVHSPTVLNRARAKHGKPPIPSHTIIRVGHVYERGGGAVPAGEHARRGQPLHWRAGYTAVRWITKRHAKWQAELANDMGTHQLLVYVEPYLVNYDPLVDKLPDIPERRVTW